MPSNVANKHIKHHLDFLLLRYTAEHTFNSWTTVSTSFSSLQFLQKSFAWRHKFKINSYCMSTHNTMPSNVANKHIKHHLDFLLLRYAAEHTSDSWTTVSSSFSSLQFLQKSFPWIHKFKINSYCMSTHNTMLSNVANKHIKHYLDFLLLRYTAEHTSNSWTTVSSSFSSLQFL